MILPVYVLVLNASSLCECGGDECDECDGMFVISENSRLRAACHPAQSVLCCRHLHTLDAHTSHPTNNMSFMDDILEKGKDLMDNPSQIGDYLNDPSKIISFLGQEGKTMTSLTE